MGRCYSIILLDIDDTLSGNRSVFCYFWRNVISFCNLIHTCWLVRTVCSTLIIFPWLRSVGQLDWSDVNDLSLMVSNYLYQQLEQFFIRLFIWRLNNIIYGNWQKIPSIFILLLIQRVISYEKYDLLVRW